MPWLTEMGRNYMFRMYEKSVNKIKAYLAACGMTAPSCRCPGVISDSVSRVVSHHTLSSITCVIGSRMLTNNFLPKLQSRLLEASMISRSTLLCHFAMVPGCCVATTMQTWYCIRKYQDISCLNSCKTTR